MRRFHIYLAERPARFTTTQERIEALSRSLGVSKNKAVAYAVNELYERLNIRDEELERNFLFAALPEDTKEAIRRAPGPKEKRALLVQAAKTFSE